MVVNSFSAAPNELLFLPLGGSEEIGMNLNLYHYGGKWLMVDLGITFGDETTLGIDVIMPDPSFIEARKKDLVGLVVTHGHEDHIGAIPYLWERLGCRIYATPFTASLIRRKLANIKVLDKVDLVEIPLSSAFTVDPFEIELIGAAHSIPEANGLALRCEVGTIFHTGDWKFDTTFDRETGRTDFSALEALAEENILAVVGDSTNADLSGRTASESELLESLSELFRNQKYRIAVTCFSSNVARLRSVSLAAQRNGRHVALVGQSLWRMNEIARENGYLLDVPDFLSPKDIGYIPRDKIVMICTGSQGEQRAVLARLADRSHHEINLEKEDTVVFSSREIPGNEKAIARIQSKLVAQGIKVISERDHFVHVSGHPGQDDMVEMYQIIRPEIAIPVHGDSRRLMEHARLAKECQIPQILIPENGSVMRLHPSPAKIISRVTTSNLGVDGPKLRQVDGSVFRDRQKLLHHGNISVTVILDSTCRCKIDPILTIVGIITEDEAPEFNNLLIDLIRSSLEQMPMYQRKSDDDVRENVRRSIRKLIRGEFGKRPMTSVHVVRY